MREILFRGKMKTDNCQYKKGDWVYGDLCRLKDGDKELPHIYGCGEVFRETIGQYTGLTDKNGKKIFEGDIVKYGDTVHKVIFENRNNTAYFGLVYSPLETRPFGHYQDLRQIEVVGNIHDNPELLNRGEE